MADKGAAFEAEVCEAMAQQMPRLGMKAERVFKRKNYPSRNHDGTIAVDLSIEIQAEGETKPSALWVWECKDQSSPVDVEDVRAFHAKLQDIGLVNVRGTIVSRGPFSKAALEFAREHSIGAARYTPEPPKTGEEPAKESGPGEFPLSADEWIFLTHRLDTYFHRWRVDCPEDLVQDTLFRLFRKLHAGILVTDLRAYAMGIAQNVWRDYQKKRVAEERNFQGHGLMQYDEAESAPPQPIPRSDQWDAVNSRIELERYLQEIPEIERHMLTSYYGGGETLSELADRLRMSPVTVRHHLRRITDRLAQAHRRQSPKPPPVIKPVIAKRNASAQLAASIIARAVLDGKWIPDDIWEEINELPGFAVDRSSFAVAGGGDVIYKATLDNPDGTEVVVWSRVTATGAGKSSKVVFGTSRDEVLASKAG